MARSCHHVLDEPQTVRGSAVTYAGEDRSPYQPIPFHRSANFRYCDLAGIIRKSIEAHALLTIQAVFQVKRLPVRSAFPRLEL